MRRWTGGVMAAIDTDVAATISANPAEKRYFLIIGIPILSRFRPISSSPGCANPCQPYAAKRCLAGYWMVSIALVDEPKSPRVRNDRLKPMLCVTSLVFRSRDCEYVIR